MKNLDLRTNLTFFLLLLLLITVVLFVFAFSSTNRSFYGPDGPYANFAGKECGIALAKMSFDDEHLNDLAGCENLNFGEKEELDGWVEKFTYYRNYPVKGRLVGDAYLVSLANRILTNEDLSENTGINKEDIPKGYAASPIYIGAGNKVFDASFGGVEFYGKLCRFFSEFSRLQFCLVKLNLATATTNNSCCCIK